MVEEDCMHDKETFFDIRGDRRCSLCDEIIDEEQDIKTAM